MVQNPGYSSLIFLILLFLSGCATSQWPKPEKELFSPPVVIGNRISLHMPGDLNCQEKALLISAATVQIEHFERDWGHGSDPVHVYFSRGSGSHIPCGNRIGKFWGCHYGPNGPIHVWLDPYFIAISLYHELVHHNHANANDHEHDDPKWETFWKPRQNAIRDNLRRKHKRILGRR